MQIVYRGVDRLLSVNKKTLDDGSVYHECRYGEELNELVSEFKAAGYNVDWSGPEYVLWFKLWW